MEDSRDSRLVAYRGARIQAAPSRARGAAKPVRSAMPGQQREQFGADDSSSQEGPGVRSAPGVPRGPQAQARLDERAARRRQKRARAPTEAQSAQNDGSPGSKSRVTWTSGSAAMAADRAVQTRKEEDMRQPAKVWTDPGFEQESLERLRQEFKRQNLTGTRKLSPFSVRKYDQTLEDFIRSLV